MENLERKVKKKTPLFLRNIVDKRLKEDYMRHEGVNSMLLFKRPVPRYLLRV